MEVLSLTFKAKLQTNSLNQEIDPCELTLMSSKW